MRKAPAPSWTHRPPGTQPHPQHPPRLGPRLDGAPDATRLLAPGAVGSRPDPPCVTHPPRPRQPMPNSGPQAGGVHRQGWEWLQSGPQGCGGGTGPGRTKSLGWKGAQHPPRGDSGSVSGSPRAHRGLLFLDGPWGVSQQHPPLLPPAQGETSAQGGPACHGHGI